MHEYYEKYIYYKTNYLDLKDHLISEGLLQDGGFVPGARVVGKAAKNAAGIAAKGVGATANLAVQGTRIAGTVAVGTAKGVAKGASVVITAPIKVTQGVQAGAHMYNMYRQNNKKALLKIGNKLITNFLDNTFDSKTSTNKLIKIVIKILPVDDLIKYVLKKYSLDPRLTPLINNLINNLVTIVKETNIPNDIAVKDFDFNEEDLYSDTDLKNIKYIDISENKPGIYMDLSSSQIISIVLKSFCNLTKQEFINFLKLLSKITSDKDIIPILEKMRKKKEENKIIYKKQLYDIETKIRNTDRNKVGTLSKTRDELEKKLKHNEYYEVDDIYKQIKNLLQEGYISNILDSLILNDTFVNKIYNQCETQIDYEKFANKLLKGETLSTFCIVKMFIKNFLDKDILYSIFINGLDIVEKKLSN